MSDLCGTAGQGQLRSFTYYSFSRSNKDISKLSHSILYSHPHTCLDAT